MARLSADAGPTVGDLHLDDMSRLAEIRGQSLVRTTVEQLRVALGLECYDDALPELQRTRSRVLADAGLAVLARTRAAVEDPASQQCDSAAVVVLDYGDDQCTCGMGPDALAQQAARYSQARELYADGNRLTPAGGAVIGRSFPHLEYLELNNNVLGAVGVASLASLTQLRHVGMCGAGLGSRGADALARSLPQLRYLDIGANAVGVEGARAIAQRLSQLTHLGIGDNAIGNDGAAALTSLRCLRYVDVRLNQLTVIPPELVFLPHLEVLVDCAAGNALESPPEEVCDGGVQAMRCYAPYHEWRVRDRVVLLLLASRGAGERPRKRRHGFCAFLPQRIVRIVAAFL